MRTSFQTCNFWNPQGPSSGQRVGGAVSLEVRGQKQRPLGWAWSWVAGSAGVAERPRLGLRGICPRSPTTAVLGWHPAPLCPMRLPQARGMTEGCPWGCFPRTPPCAHTVCWGSVLVAVLLVGALTSCPDGRGWDQPSGILMSRAIPAQPSHCGQHWIEAVGSLWVEGGRVVLSGMGSTDSLFPALCPKLSRTLSISGAQTVHRVGSLSPDPGPWTLGLPRSTAALSSDPICPAFPSITSPAPPPESSGLSRSLAGGTASGNWGSWPGLPLRALADHSASVRGVVDVQGRLGLGFVVQLSCERCRQQGEAGRGGSLCPWGSSKVGLGSACSAPLRTRGSLPGRPWSIALEL